MELGIKGHLMALNKCAKFESTDNTEILLTHHLTYLTLKMGNSKVKVKSHYGILKNLQHKYQDCTSSHLRDFA